MNLENDNKAQTNKVSIDYKVFDTFINDSEFRGYVKAKIEEFSDLKPIVKELCDKVSSMWGYVIGAGAVAGVAATIIFNLLTKK